MYIISLSNVYFHCNGIGSDTREKVIEDAQVFLKDRINDRRRLLETLKKVMSENKLSLEEDEAELKVSILMYFRAIYDQILLIY